MKGESSQPCSLKIGPSKNGLQETVTPAVWARSSILEADRYEYVLPNSYQNSKSGVDKACSRLG